MRILGSKLAKYPVLSMHLGGRIADIQSLIISPHNLKLIGFLAKGPDIRNEAVLDTVVVREFSKVGIIIDSEDDFRDRGDILKIEEILQLNFSLFGKKVKTKKGSHLGKVIDFIIDTDSGIVIQLIVKRPLYKSLNDPELVIDRKSVVEVNDFEIIIKDEEEKVKKPKVAKDFVPNFVNPFKEPDFAIEPKRRARNN